MDDKTPQPVPAGREVHKRTVETRTYIYNSGDLQQLFAKIIESLGSEDESSVLIENILTAVCRHFKFGCGFVYEADHTHTFYLKEQYASYQLKGLPTSFELERHFSIEEMERLIRNSVFYHHSDEDGKVGIGHSNTTRIFNSNTLMLVPAFGKDDTPIGLVGMMDRRRNIFLDEQGVKAAQMVLNLLANHIKLRYYQRNLEFAEKSLVNLLDNTGIDIYVNDFYTHEILYVNKSMAAPYGGRDNMIDRKCWAAIYTDKSGPCDYCPQKRLIDQNGNPTKIYSWDYQRPFDGSWFRVLSAAFQWTDGRLAHVVSSVDITENKRNEATIAMMANYDALTNLPNRRKLMQDCAEYIKSDRDHDHTSFILFFDLDDFKKLNDGVGHQAGDELLRAIGATMQANDLTRNRAYRYGGDEFIILLDDCTKEEATAVVKFLLKRFNEPWHLTEIEQVCRASIGVACYPVDGSTADELLHKADMMMYKAKELGRGVACFSDGEMLSE